jgi:hypothetical protein
MAPREVERSVTNTRASLQAAAIGDGHGAILEAQTSVREWGPAAIDGDEARTCFIGDYGLRQPPSPQFSVNAGPDGWFRWTQHTYVHLTRAPGGPWRLVSAFTPSHG